MHSLLARQLKKQFGESFRVPAEWKRFVDAVDDAYREFDSDRELLERALDLSSGELLQANAEMRAFFLAIPDILFRIDQNGVILDYKAGSVEDFLLPPKELIGKRIQDVPAKGLSAQFHDAIARVIRERSVVSTEYSLVLREEKRWYEARFVLLPEGDIVVIVRDITMRKQIDEQLRLQSAAISNAPSGIVVIDKDGAIVWGNPAFEELVGCSSSEAIGKNLREFVEPGPMGGEIYDKLWKVVRHGKPWHGELLSRRRNGTVYTEGMTIAPVFDNKGSLSHLVAIKQDISERRSLEERFLQAQKLEGIGRLAGGVAHDYNNILGVIVGYAEILKKRFDKGDPGRLIAEAIAAAANRGADLTRQLLAFARKEIVSPKVINVNLSIESIRTMLQRIIGENLSLAFLPQKNLWNVKIDPTQLDQILVNLATNARDAIKDVGRIEIRTSNVNIDESLTQGQPEFYPGEYVLISFADTGKGMDKETLEHIFEPFFTTKPKGQGTGLGLSTVYGIVKQNNGTVTVASKLNKGTEFRIYLPRFHGEVIAEEETTSEEDLMGDETILVVEDEEDLLDMARITLEDYGYKIIGATRPKDALLYCQTHEGEIHLLLTDVIMPTMNGKELSERIRLMRPGIKTLFMSGHTSDTLVPQGILDDSIELLLKPFTPRELAKRIRALLTA